MDVSPVSLVRQMTIERRFNCMICLCARFQMVYGRCQHRICTKCAYGSSGVLRRQFHRCPSCQQDDAFPERKPTIPEDNIEHQKFLGVVSCDNKGCSQEFWSWEKEEHELTCPHKPSQRDRRSAVTPKKQSTTTPRTRTRQSNRTSKTHYKLRLRQHSYDSKSHNSGYQFRQRHERSNTTYL